MPVRDGSIPPMLMFRSFLTIASGYVGHWAIVFLVTYLVSASFFPEYLADMEAAREQGQALTEAEAFGSMPRTMTFTITGIAAVLCVLLGIFIGLTAPFGRLVHTIFLAVIVGVNYLSESLQAPPEKKFVLMTYLLVLPMAILLGGYLINRKMADYDQANLEQTPRMLGDDQ